MTATVPALRLEVRLEGVPRVHLDASSPDDEQRLIAWLESSDVLERVASALQNLPRDLDAIDEANWSSEMLAPLEHVESRGSRDRLAVCPICRRFALAVHTRVDDRLLVTCFNGCPVETIHDALERAAA